MFSLALGAVAFSLPFTLSKTTTYSVSASADDDMTASSTFVLAKLSHLDPRTSTCTFLALVCFLYILKLAVSAFTSPLRHVPGPFYTRFSRLPLKRSIMTGQRIFFIDNLHKKHGPVVRISPSEVAIADPEAFTQIHRVGSKFMKSIWYQQLANFPKAGVFTMLDSKEHGPRRRLLSRPFSRTHLVEHWERIVKDKVKLCVSKIKRDALEGNAELFNWWMLLASDVSAHLAFGESFRMLETEEVRLIREAREQWKSDCYATVEIRSHESPQEAHHRRWHVC